MDLKLARSEVLPDSRIAIAGSKSETNRLLILQALFPEIALENPSDSDDSRVMKTALMSGRDTINVNHAGTAMRFLTAFFAIADGRETVLTGSERMKQRPIKILVDALRELGADIEYLENDGFPPVKITGRTLLKNTVSLSAEVSSQYISALLLIAAKLENGLEIELGTKITSRPYIEMTLALLNDVGIKTSVGGNAIKVFPAGSLSAKKVSVESDWSSASYFYSIVALSPVGTQITLSSFKPDSFQGDNAVAGIYKLFGVETAFERDSVILLTKTANAPQNILELDLNATPDLAQTIAVTAFGLGIQCKLTGLQTLKIKETDRIEALKAELEKLGARVAATSDSLTIEPAGPKFGVSIKTYGDHRMAMAFAPLALKVPLRIENAEVVSKSYPGFWGDLKSIGFAIRGSA